MSMKKLLVLATLGTVLVAPAFAQQAPNAGREGDPRSLRGAFTIISEPP